MNLENLNLVELNAQEVEIIDGGSLTVREIQWILQFAFGVIDGFKENR